MSEKASNPAGFRVAQGMAGIGLQNRCTTTVLSRPIGGFPRVSAATGQRRKREKREGDRFGVARCVAHSVPFPFRINIGPAGDCNLRTGPDTSERALMFDHATTLPRKASLADPTQCVLYFIAGAGLIKIGVTTNLKSRFRAIRNSSPVPLELLATLDGCTFYEGKAHSQFAHLRRHGEWFEDNGEIREYILAFRGRPNRTLSIPDGSSLVPLSSPLTTQEPS